MITLKKFIKKLYHLISIFSLFLIFSMPVNAEQGIASANGQKFITSFSGTFADNTNDNLTRIASGFDDRNIRFYSDPIILSGTPNYGAAVIFDALEPFVAGYTYSVSLLLNTNYNNVLHPSSNRVCVAETLNNAIARFNQRGNFPCTNAISTTYTTGNPNPFYIDNSNTGNLLNYNILTFVFTPDFTGTSIVFNFNSNVRGTYTLFFGGYISTVLSDNKTGVSANQVQSIINNSGLASAQSVEEIKQSNQIIINNINNIDNTMNDSSVDSSDSTINELKNKIPTNSVISDLLLLPIRFLRNFVNALGSSCSRFSLGSLYGTELFMPCINIESYLGSAIWTTIDLIISGLFVYSLRKKFIEIYENLTNLKNGGNEID